MKIALNSNETAMSKAALEMIWIHKELTTEKKQKETNLKLSRQQYSESSVGGLC